MINYYDILGVSESAGIDEIKTAFRKLAKQYHPDRNPNGKEFFERALLAYETLSDPQRKTAYDYRLKAQTQGIHGGAAPPKSAQGKNWKFDERELKRRQYYNDHIRKYAKETASYNAKAKEKKSYNEYKYILLATPLAVLLFVMIMKLAGPVVPKKKLSHSETAGTLASPQLKPGDAPYNFIFGNPKYEMNDGRKLLIKNMTGRDAIVCIFSGGLFVRSFYIQGGFSAEVPQLPSTPLDIRYVTGQHFDYRTTLREARIMGGFAKKAEYYKSVSAFVPGESAELSLVAGISEGFVKTGEKDFFETTK